MKQLGLLVTVVTGVTAVTVTGMANAAVINVPDDYAEIQTAIEAANEGDIVLVQPGTYVETLDFLGKGITVTGTAPEDSVVVASTVVDANAQGSVAKFVSGEDSTSVLSGFTLTGGTGTDTDGPANTRGGGIYASGASPTVSGCVIIDNIAMGEYPAGRGGGVYWEEGHVQLRNSRIEYNHADAGNGMALLVSNSDGLMSNLVVANNGVHRPGGAITLVSYTGTLRTSRVIDNLAKGIDAYSSPCRITNCLISGNHSSGSGGGIRAWWYEPTYIGNCLIINNRADERGGGLNFYWSSTAIVENCTIANNVAALGGNGASTSGPGPSPAIRNGSFWSSIEQDIVVDTGSLDISHSNVQGGYPGEGNIDADPLFVDPENGDYHLQLDSPCIDAGDPTTFDACLPPGLGGPRADMGSYGGEENCGWLPPCDDLTLAGVSIPSPVYSGDTAQGSLSLWNCSDNPIDVEAAWDCTWLDVVPAQGTIPPQTTVDLALELDASELTPGSFSCPVTISYGEEGEIVATVRLSVASPFSIEVTDHPQSVRQGKRLRWEFDIINLTDQQRSADAWFDAYLLNGNPFWGNPISGPYTGTIAAGDTASFFNVVKVPDVTPIGSPYRICNLIGAHPAVWDSTCFEFAVQP